MATQQVAWPDIPISITSSLSENPDEPANFNFHFSETLKLDPKGQYVWITNTITCWYSWTNVSEAQNNNLIRYRTSDAGEWKDVVLPDAQLNVEDIDKYVKEAMLANGDVGTETFNLTQRQVLINKLLNNENLSPEENAQMIRSLQRSINAEGDTIYYISITPNYATGYVEVTLDNDYELDFSQSDISLLLGFDSGTTLSGNGKHVADEPANIQNGIETILVQLSIVQDSWFNGKNGSFIYQFAPVKGEVPNSQIVREPRFPTYINLRMTADGQISDIRVRFTDQDFRQMDFRGRNNDTTIFGHIRRIA